jgi:hypothetical protein
MHKEMLSSSWQIGISANGWRAAKETVEAQSTCAWSLTLLRPRILLIVLFLWSVALVFFVNIVTPNFPFTGT